LNKIHSISPYGEIRERLWDNRSGKFFALSGKRIDVEIGLPEEEKKRYTQNSYSSNCSANNLSPEEKKGFDDFFSRVRFNKTTLGKKKDIVSLRIQMGMDCNYSCQYCKQTTHKKYDPHATLEDTRRLIENFRSFCTTGKDEPINIQLWGGEPFLYWDSMVLLGEFFRREFKNARITVLSNGSLATWEKMCRLLDNDITLAISHDGPGQLDYRSGDCLREGSTSLIALQYYASQSREPLYVNAVITRNRYDLPGIIEHIEKLLGKNTRVGFEGIVLVEDEKQFTFETMFQEDDYLALRGQVAHDILIGKLQKVGMFQAKINNLISCVVDPKYLLTDDIQQKCSMDSPYNVSIDLKGNVLACHSTPLTIGNVSDLEASDLSRIGFQHWSARKTCLSCPVLPICRGGCLAQSELAFFHSCNNEFHFHMIFFEVVFNLLFGERILAIDGVIRPDRPQQSKEVERCQQE
jgi:uncharacterized protein